MHNYELTKSDWFVIAYGAAIGSALFLVISGNLFFALFGAMPGMLAMLVVAGLHKSLTRSGDHVAAWSQRLQKTLHVVIVLGLSMFIAQAAWADRWFGACAGLFFLLPMLYYMCVRFLQPTQVI